MRMEQRRPNLLSPVHRYCCCASVWVLPALVTAGLSGLTEASLVAARRNSSTRALGMQDFGSIGWERLIALRVLLRNHLKYGSELGQCSFSGGHQRMASRDRRHFGNPAARLILVEHDLVVVQAHVSIVSERGR